MLAVKANLLEIQWLKQGSMTPALEPKEPILVYSSLLIWIQFLSLGVTYNYSNSPSKSSRIGCKFIAVVVMSYHCQHIFNGTSCSQLRRKDAFEPLGKKHDYQVLSYLSLWFLASIKQ